jgi:hypothetical protein
MLLHPDEEEDDDGFVGLITQAEAMFAWLLGWLCWLDWLAWLGGLAWMA